MGYYDYCYGNILLLLLPSGTTVFFFLFFSLLLPYVTTILLLLLFRHLGTAMFHYTHAWPPPPSIQAWCLAPEMASC